MTYIPVASPVYVSVADLEQYASPQTDYRYATVLGLGLFGWSPSSAATRDAKTVLGRATIGRWLLKDPGQNAIFVSKNSGDTLTAMCVNVLSDNAVGSPVFVLPNATLWSGRKLWAKRVAQTALTVSISVSGGATIDGSSTYTMSGVTSFVEFISDGTSVYLGGKS